MSQEFVDKLLGNPGFIEKDFDGKRDVVKKILTAKKDAFTPEEIRSILGKQEQQVAGVSQRNTPADFAPFGQSDFSNPDVHTNKVLSDLSGKTVSLPALAEESKAVGNQVRGVLAGKDLETASTTPTTAQEVTGLQPESITPLEGLFSFLSPLAGATLFPKATANEAVTMVTDPLNFLAGTGAARGLTKGVGTATNLQRGAGKGSLPEGLPPLQDSGPRTAPSVVTEKDKAIALSKEAQETVPTSELVNTPDDSVAISQHSVLGEKHVPLTMKQRAFQGSRESLTHYGPEGVESAKLLNDRDFFTDVQYTKAFLETKDELEKIFGKRNILSRSNPLKQAGIRKELKITPAEEKALFDYTYSGGVEDYILGLPKESQTKIRRAANAIFNKGTKPVGDHAGVRTKTIRTTDPETGKRIEIPVGAPKMFLPNMPLLDSTRGAIRGKAFDRALKQAQAKNPGLTEGGFRRQLRQESEDISLGKRTPGIDTERLIDADLEFIRQPDGSVVVNRVSAYDTLRELGYNTDIFQILVRYQRNGFRAGENALIEPRLTALAKRMEDKLIDKGATEAEILYPRAAIERDMGKGDLELTDELADEWLSKALSFNSGTLLQNASLAQINQLTFPILRGGFRNLAKGAVDYMKKVPKSHPYKPEEIKAGSLGQVLLQEYQAPKNGMASLSAFTLRANGFHVVEKSIRKLINPLFRHYMDDTLRKLLKNPNKAELRAKIREMGLDPDRVVKRGGYTDLELNRTINRFTNESTSRQTPGNFPLAMTSGKPLARALTQFKSFALGNTAQVNRDIPKFYRAILKEGGTPLEAFNGAFKRALRGTIAGAMIGEFTQDAYRLIVRRELPHERKNNKWIEDKVGKVLDNPTVVTRILENLLAAYGTMQAILIYSVLAAQDPETGLAKAFMPAVLSPVGDVANAALKLAEGKPKIAAAEIARRLPLVGPFLADSLRREKENPFKNFGNEFGGFDTKPNKLQKAFGR